MKMPASTIRTGLILAGLVALSPAALADIAEVTTADDKVMTFEYQGDKLRINTPEGEGYMVMRDGHMYVVSVSDGQPMVFDMNSAFSMFGGMAASATPEAVEGHMISLKSTGRSETLGGMKGEVYILRFVDADGKEQSEEIVLSDDPRALGFRDAISDMAMTMSKSIDEEKFRKEMESGQEMQKELQKLNKGVLRYGDDMKIRSIKDVKVADERFALPAEPTDLGAAMGNMFGGQGTDSGSSGGGLGSIFGKKVDRQEDRVEQKADDAVDNATDSAVDKALDKAFNKLFGN